MIDWKGLEQKCTKFELFLIRKLVLTGFKKYTVYANKSVKQRSENENVSLWILSNFDNL